MTSGQRQVAVLGTSVVVGAMAHAWMFLPPTPILGFMAWSVTGAPFEYWWYTLPDAQRTMHVYEVGSALAELVYPLAVAVSFVLWVGPLRRGVPEVPASAIRLIRIVAVLSAVYHVLGARYGFVYQGALFIAITLGANVAVYAALMHASRRLQAAPSWRGSLLLQAATLAWIVGLAFPWLGERL